MLADEWIVFALGKERIQPFLSVTIVISNLLF